MILEYATLFRNRKITPLRRQSRIYLHSSLNPDREIARHFQFSLSTSRSIDTNVPFFFATAHCTIPVHYFSDLSFVNGLLHITYSHRTSPDVNRFSKGFNNYTFTNLFMAFMQASPLSLAPRAGNAYRHGLIVPHLTDLFTRGGFPDLRRRNPPIH